MLAFGIANTDMETWFLYQMTPFKPFNSDNLLLFNCVCKKIVFLSASLQLL